MGGWLTKAKSAIGRRRRRREPVPFEVTSSAGCVIEGVRTAESQIVTCPATGERLFVLPLDAYPEVGRSTGRRGRKASATSRTRTSPSKRDSSDGRTGRRSRPSGRATPEERRERRRERMADARRKVGIGMQRAREQATKIGRWFTPLRGTVVAMAVVILATIVLAVRSNARDRAEITLRDATRTAWDALDAGKFEEANDAFQDVVAALDTLGRDDAEVRRAAREVEIARSLTDFPIVDVLADADRFDERHRGAWVVLDATAEVVPDANGNPVVRIEYPLEVDDVPVDLVVGLDVFAELGVSESAVDPFRTLFAARLGELEREGEPFPRWELRLEEPLLWVHGRTLPAAGLVMSDEVAGVLDQQAAAVGLEGGNEQRRVEEDGE